MSAPESPLDLAARLTAELAEVEAKRLELAAQRKAAILSAMKAGVTRNAIAKRLKIHHAQVYRLIK